MLRRTCLFALLVGCASSEGTMASDAGKPSLDASFAPDATNEPDSSPVVDSSIVDAGPFFPPDKPGPYSCDSRLDQVASASGTIKADYYLPKIVSTLPIVFLRHGYTRDKSNLTGWATLLCSHGFVAVLPTTTDSGTATTGEADLEACISFTLASSTTQGSFLNGHVDGKRVVVGGHSSGGLAATLTASAKKVAVAGLVLLDTEGAAAGNAAATSISVPTVAAFAEPDNSGQLSCNENGAGVQTANALVGPTLAFRIKNASHCDLESNSDQLCALACGAMSPTRLDAAETYVMAFLMFAFQCESRALPYVNGAVIASDARVAVLRQSMLPPSCL